MPNFYRFALPAADAFGHASGGRSSSCSSAGPIVIATAFKTVIALELDPAHVIADLEEQREKNEKRREFWRSFLSRAPMLLAVLACTLALSFSAISGSAPSALESDELSSSDSEAAIN